LTTKVMNQPCFLKGIIPCLSFLLQT